MRPNGSNSDSVTSHFAGVCDTKNYPLLSQFKLMGKGILGQQCIMSQCNCMGLATVKVGM